MSNKEKNDWGDREAGALWIRNGKKQDFLSGKVKIDGEERKIIVFRNKGKTAANKAPDYVIYLDADQDKDPFIKRSNAPQNDLNSPIKGDQPVGSDGLPEDPPF